MKYWVLLILGNILILILGIYGPTESTNATHDFYQLFLRPTSYYVGIFTLMLVYSFAIFVLSKRGAKKILPEGGYRDLYTVLFFAAISLAAGVLALSKFFRLGREEFSSLNGAFDGWGRQLCPGDRSGQSGRTSDHAPSARRPHVRVTA